MSHGPGLGNFGRSWAHSFSAQSHWWNLSCKTHANSSALLALLPDNEAMHVPSPNIFTPLDKSWAHSFSAQSHWWKLSWKTRANSSRFSLYRSLPTELCPHPPTVSHSVQQSSPQAMGKSFFDLGSLFLNLTSFFRAWITFFWPWITFFGPWPTLS